MSEKSTDRLIDLDAFQQKTAVDSCQLAAGSCYKDIYKRQPLLAPGLPRRVVASDRSKPTPDKDLDNLFQSAVAVIWTLVISILGHGSLGRFHVCAELADASCANMMMPKLTALMEFSASHISRTRVVSELAVLDGPTAGATLMRRGTDVTSNAMIAKD